MAIGQKKVFATVVVIVENVQAPPGEQAGDLSEVRNQSGVGKALIAVVSEEGIGFVGKSTGHDVRESVIVQVNKVGPHSGECLSVFGVTYPSNHTHLSECPVAIVLK